MGSQEVFGQHGVLSGERIPPVSPPRGMRCGGSRLCLRATARAEERPHVSGEALARLVTDIEHVPAGIELELRALRLCEGRQVIEYVTACHIRGHQIGIAVGNDQPEGRVESQENTEVVADALRR